MLKKLAQTLLNFFEYAIKCCSFFSYILAIFPKNKTISLSSKSHSSKLHSFFKILILLISRYNKASAVFFKKVRFYDAKDKFFLLDLNMNEYTQCGHYLNMFGKEDYVLMDQIRNSKAKNVMIDIGANVGFYSLFFSSIFWC